MMMVMLVALLKTSKIRLPRPVNLPLSLTMKKRRWRVEEDLTDKKRRSKRAINELQMDGGEELETPNGKGADQDGIEYDEEEDKETDGTNAKGPQRKEVFEYEDCGDDECETQMIF